MIGKLRKKRRRKKNMRRKRKRKRKKKSKKKTIVLKLFLLKLTIKIHFLNLMSKSPEIKIRKEILIFESKRLKKARSETTRHLKVVCSENTFD